MLLVGGSCLSPVAESNLALSAQRQASYQQLVLAAGRLEIPRYIRFKELRRDDLLLPTMTPTLQRGTLSHSLRFSKDRIYLYSVDADGAVLVGQKDPRPDYPYCGHPNLTGGLAARMSGEIWYDAKLKALLINNDSGRYGFQSSRRADQLSAVVALIHLVGYAMDDGSRPPLAERWIKIRRNHKSSTHLWPKLRGAPAGFDVVAWKHAFMRATGLATRTADLREWDAFGRSRSASSRPVRLSFANPAMVSP